MEWHDEFRAYARAFGRDEVAAILLRSAEREWIVWPDQTVEGLTFTLTADAILSSVPPDDLQHVVGWVHSHPHGIEPSPSGTDDGQIRALAADMAGAVAEMVIFGGHAYSKISVTYGVQVAGRVFVSDTDLYQQGQASSPWDDQATAFYSACKPLRPVGNLPHVSFAGAWNDGPEYDHDHVAFGDDGQPRYWCTWCSRTTSETPGMLCDECDWQSMRAETASRYE